MNLQNIPILAMMTKKMSWLNERQRVLSQNIANADTPGFTPKDLKPVDFAKEVAAFDRKLRVAATVPGHIAPKTSGSDWRSDQQKKTYEVAPDGNAVVIEEQMLKVADSQVDYQMMTTLYKKNIGLLKLALGRGR